MKQNNIHYEIKIFKEVTVMKNGYVQLYEDKHYYSVPYRFYWKRSKTYLFHTSSSANGTLINLLIELTGESLRKNK